MRSLNVAGVMNEFDLVHDRVEDGLLQRPMHEKSPGSCLPNELDESITEVLAVVAVQAATVRGDCEGGFGGKAKEAEVKVLPGRPADCWHDPKSAGLEECADCSAQPDAQDSFMSR